MMKTKTLEILIGATILAISASIALPVTNELAGTSVDAGSPESVSFTYCGGYAGVGANHHCVLWMTGHEVRQPTIIHGLWWESTGYRIVR
jgi:hypothetical protein